MKHKKIVFAILILIIIVGAVVILKPKEDEKENNKIDKNQVAEEISDFTKETVSDTSTKKGIEERVGQEVSSMDLLAGKDSYLREVPTISGEDISEYKTKANEYASRVESYIKNNLDYTIDSTTESVDGQTLVVVTIKTYYYNWYLNDLTKLQSEISKLAGYDYETSFDGKPTNETNTYMFKSKVKAMELLDNYLDDYINNYEHLTIDVIYDPDDPKVTNSSLMSYYLQLGGINYKSMQPGTKEFQDKQATKIKKIIDTALQTGEMNKNNPLKLK